MDNIKFSKYQKYAIALFFGALLVSQPYIITLMIGISNEFLWLPLILLLFLLSLSYKRTYIPSSFYVCCLIQALIWIIFSIIHSDTSYITRIIFIILTILQLASMDKIIGLKNTIYLHNKFLTAQSVLAALAFILFFIGILSPIIEFQLRDSRPAYFLGITFTNSISGNIIRPSGFFDEPGALAAWGIYALIFNKLFYGNKKIEYLLIASLMLTLSLAYYIQVAIYFLLFYSKNIKAAIPIAVLVFIAYFIVASDTSSEIYRLTIGRIMGLEEGGLESTSRGAMTEVSKEYFKSSPWIGIGARETENIGVYSSDNPYETLGKDGIIGTIALYLPLLYVLFSKFNRYIWSAIAILAVGYLQRPFHLNIMHYSMMYSFCILALSNCEILSNNKSYGISNA